jgi:hypothetical protein
MGSEETNMQTEIRKPEQVFTLDIVAPLLGGLELPSGPFDPQGDWQHRYGVYTLAGITTRAVAGRVGSLTIRRRAQGTAAATIAVKYEHDQIPGWRLEAAGRMECRVDPLATPLRWEYDSQVVDEGGKADPLSLLSKTAQVTGGKLEIRDGRRCREIALPGAYTINWAVLEAVGRLPRGPFEPLRFDMLDHFDQFKGCQSLGYRESTDVLLDKKRNRPTRLHAYDHVGEGIVPWVYWVDDQGRLLFAIGGQEAFVIEVAT